MVPGIYPVKGRGNEEVHKLEGAFDAHVPLAEAEDVRIVVLARQAHGEPVARRSGPHAGEFVRGNGHADARAADEYAEVVFMVRYRRGNLFCDNGIVGALAGVHAHVIYDVSLLVQVGDDLFFQFNARVVISDDQFHVPFSFLALGVPAQPAAGAGKPA